MRLLRAKNRRFMAMAGAVILMTSTIVTAVSTSDAYADVAPGCTASQPTAIGGPIYGYGGDYDGWTVHVQVGIDLTNAAGIKINPDGSPVQNPTQGYSYNDYVNPDLAQPGQATGGDRTWGHRYNTDYLCVSADAVEAFMEVYPKDPGDTQPTDKTYFGEAADQHRALTIGATNTFLLRIPTQAAYNGNTGAINGYVTYNGHQIKPPPDHVLEEIIKPKVWPNDPGSACGVQGFSAGPVPPVDDVSPSSTMDADYYVVGGLAGGQCGASTQSYRMIVHCLSVCGMPDNVVSVSSINVGNGTRPRVDISFTS